MDYVNELNEAISSGLAGFKAFIQKKISIQVDFLEQFFWTSDASQMTVLNYLIHLYAEPKSDAVAVEPENTRLREMIDYIVSLPFDKNMGEPLHQAISAGKIQLALHFLDAEKKTQLEADSLTFKITSRLNKIDKKNKPVHSTFDVDRRDQEGRTVLSLALNTKDIDLIIAALNKGPNIHAATCMSTVRVPFQPIHQAVVLDCSDGVRLLAHQGAQLANPCGLGQDTAVLLAAHLGKINALEALLEQPVNSLALEALRSTNVDGTIIKQTAIERLCEQAAGVNQADALRGVAMLLCRGAEPPRSEVMRQFLSSNRLALLRHIHAYLEDKPELVDAFVNRCHLTESVLHNVIYAHHSWGNAIRRLFGKPSEVAFVLENLVVRKYTSVSVDEQSSLSTAAATNLSAETDPLKLYALFVRRYTDAYDSQLLTNSWSTMRWMIADGQCDWGKVKRYVETNPKSRSAIIYNEMFKPMPKVHDDIEPLESQSPLLASM